MANFQAAAEFNTAWFNFAYAGRIRPLYKETVYCDYANNTIMGFLEDWADKDYVDSTEVRHIEEHMQQCKVVVQTTTAASTPNAPFTFTYSATSSLAAYNPVSVGAVVYLPHNGNLIPATVTATDSSANTITVVLWDGAASVTLTANQEVIFSGGGKLIDPCGCPTCNPVQVAPGIEFRSKLALWFNCLKLCPSDAIQFRANATRLDGAVPSIDDPCKFVDCLWHNQLEKMYLDFFNGKYLLGLLGQEVTSTHAEVDGITGVVGFLPAIRARAKQVTVPLAADLTITWWDDLACDLKAKRGHCTEYAMYLGCNLQAKINKFLFDKYGAGAIQYGILSNRESKACADLSVKYGFDSFCVSGITFHFHTDSLFNDECIMGASGVNGQNIGIAVPLCNTLCGGKSRKPITVNYLKGCGFDYELVESSYGMLEPSTWDGKCDTHEFTLRSYFGFEYWCLENFMYLQMV